MTAWEGLCWLVVVPVVLEMYGGPTRHRRFLLRSLTRAAGTSTLPPDKELIAGLFSL